MAFHQLDGQIDGNDKKYLLNLEGIQGVEYEEGDTCIVINFEKGNMYCSCADATSAAAEFNQLRTALAAL